MGLALSTVEWVAIGLVIVKPETVIAWHRRGFRLYWSWKSRHPLGRPSVSWEVIDLIRKMSVANPRWGAPRIHGELWKLGFELSEATVAQYMVRSRKPPSQTWRTFLANHTRELVSADFFVVPTVFFRVLFVFVVLSHDRRRPVHVALRSYFEYYERTRTHLSLGKDAPISRPIQPEAMGRIVEVLQVGGLHQRYERTAA